MHKNTKTIQGGYIIYEHSTYHAGMHE